MAISSRSAVAVLGGLTTLAAAAWAWPPEIGAAAVASWLTSHKPLLETLQGLLTTVAILAGGLWAYFKVVKGRLYQSRLETSIEGRIVSGEGYQCAVLKLTVKNVSLSRAVIDRAGSTIEVKAYPIDNYQPEFHNAILQQLGVVDAIRRHDWIEPGECIAEERLFALPAGRILALVVQFRLLKVRPRFRIFHTGVEWNSVAVVTPEPQPTTTQDPVAAA